VKQNYKVSEDNTPDDDPPFEEKSVKSSRPRRLEVGIPEEIRRTPRFPRDPAKKMRGEITFKRPRQVVDPEVARSRMKTAEEAARAAVQAVAEAEAAAAAAEQAAREAEIAEAEAEAAEAAAEAAALAIRPPKKGKLQTASVEL
jgi:myb proto-oncogene protein